MLSRNSMEPVPRSGSMPGWQGGISQGFKRRLSDWQHDAANLATSSQGRGGLNSSNAEESAKMGKEEGTHTEPGHGSTPESDTSKIDQPARKNVPSNEATPQ
jgi:hypothetical protein